jgi:hypothetical protein
MNKVAAKKLKDIAEEVARNFSNPDREFNCNNEKFSVQEIIPLSAFTAVVIYLKNTDKLGMAHFIWVKDRWTYYFPTAAHLLNLDKLVDLYAEVERKNFPKNFKKEVENEQA